MPQTRTVPTAWIHAKVCPCCGYRGPELQAIEETEVFECPVCANDLYARPPMSYAEMEGLTLGQVPGSAPALPAAASNTGRSDQALAPGWIKRIWLLLRRVLPIRA